MLKDQEIKIPKRIKDKVKKEEEDMQRYLDPILTFIRFDVEARRAALEAIWKNKKLIDRFRKGQYRLSWDSASLIRKLP